MYSASGSFGADFGSHAAACMHGWFLVYGGQLARGRRTVVRSSVGKTSGVNVYVTAHSAAVQKLRPSENANITSFCGRSGGGGPKQARRR